jgi:ribosomal protein S27AE
MKSDKKIECPWCNEMVTPEVKILKRKEGEVKERNCPRCSKVIAAYLHHERFLNMIREKVLSFKD